MQLTGSWQMKTGPAYIGPELDRTDMPTISFNDGVITMPDGSHPAYQHVLATDSPLGYATLTFDYMQADLLEPFARIVIDAGNSFTLVGTRYLSEQRLPEEISEDRMPAGVRAEAVSLFRVEYLDQVEAERAELAAGRWPFASQMSVELEPSLTH